MASWTLKKARDFYKLFNEKYPRHLKKLSRKLSLKEKETVNWTRIADKIKIKISKSKSVIEEFDGYFKKRDVVLEKLNHHFMPILPHTIPIRDVGKTQLVKQADIVMLMYLLPEEFTKILKAKNYLYYVKRTLHKSSLSPSIHAIIASEVGDITRGYLFFLFSLYADLKNTHGNTKDGIHAASLGGTWQAVIMGFAGFRIIDGMPSFEPRLPGHWKGIKFSLKWKGNDLRVSANNKRIEFLTSSHRRGAILVKCFNSVHKISFNKKYTFYK